MYNYYERTYYTLADICKKINLHSNGPYGAPESFSEFLNKALSKTGYQLNTQIGFESEQTFTCFKQYIWPRFYQEAVIYTDTDEIEDFVEKFCETKVGQIFAWWISSSEKYTLLIQNLEANKTKLLDDVKSASISRFNDTPQNSGDFSDDQHTSTVTKTENSSNVGTMMARLNEIEDNIKQLYIDWSNEFRKFIIWSVN